jgi:hypothetical protein
MPCHFHCTLFDIEPKHPALPGKVINSALRAGHPRVRGAANSRIAITLTSGVFMERYKAAVVGGLIAGVVTTAVMVAGRKSGVMTKTLDRDAVDWIDDMTGSRALIGDTGTSVVEFANHLGASAAFAAALPMLRDLAPSLSPVALGTLYGTALYAVNIGCIAPLLGITEGEIEAGPRKATERWAVHVIQAVVSAVLAERLESATEIELPF